METPFIAAFADELEKTAKFPMLKLLEELRGADRALARRQVAQGVGLASAFAAGKTLATKDKGKGEDKKMSKKAGVGEYLDRKIDEAAYESGNAQARMRMRAKVEAARRYVRGAMRSHGLDPDDPKDKMLAAGAVAAPVAGVGLAKSQLGRMARRRDMERVLKKHDAAKLQAQKAGRGKTLRTIGRVLRRGR